LGEGTEEASFSFNSCAIILLATHVQHVQHLKHPKKRGQKKKTETLFVGVKKDESFLPTSEMKTYIKLCKNQHLIANMRIR
jgi:hypothetical protein